MTSCMPSPRKLWKISDELSLHPALASITKESLLEGRTAPFHPGAEKYFREAGLIK